MPASFLSMTVTTIKCKAIACSFALIAFGELHFKVGQAGVQGFVLVLALHAAIDLIICLKPQRVPKTAMDTRPSSYQKVLQGLMLDSVSCHSITVLDSLSGIHVCVCWLQLVPAVSELIVAELLYLQYQDRTKPLYMYINSTGTSRADGETVSPFTWGIQGASKVQMCRVFPCASALLVIAFHLHCSSALPTSRQSIC